MKRQKPDKRTGDSKSARTGKMPAEYDLATRVAAVVMVEANGGNVAEAARDFGIPERTLRQWVKGERCGHVLAMSRLVKGDMTEAFRTIVWQSLTLAMGKAHAASYSQLMTGAGISVDKMLALSRADAPPPATPSVNVTVTQQTLNLSALTPDEQYRLYELLSRAAPAEPVGPDEGEPAGVPQGELPDAGARPDESVLG